jgi:hypothetical protein
VTLGARKKSIKHYDYHYVAVTLPRKEKKMDKKPDSFAASLIWGRIGAGVLCLIAAGLTVAGYDFSEVDQASAFEIIKAMIAEIERLIISLTTAFAGVMAIVSKVREKKK